MLTEENEILGVEQEDGVVLKAEHVRGLGR